MVKKYPTKQKAKSTEDLNDFAKQMRKQNEALQKLLVELNRDDKAFKRTESQTHRNKNN